MTLRMGEPALLEGREMTREKSEDVTEQCPEKRA
jgi:hypothetical protein